jgi:peptidoglycan/xylan/chitin deacetylase (PgdA/CDA1 family)
MTILCYHDVCPDWTSPLATEPAAFAAHSAWVSAHRTVLPLEQAVELLDRSGRLPPGAAALTFDDGFAGVFDHAFPVLRRTRLPATVFLVAQTLTPAGRPVDWVDTPPAQPLRTLTVDQVREMQEAGIRFQSHSWAHTDLTRLGFAECVRDLSESRQLLESLLDRPVRLLAYPRGRHNEAVREAARKAGYSHAFALPERRERVGPYSVPRVGLYHGNTVADLRLKSTRGYLRLRTGPAYGLARAAARTAARTTGRAS